MIETSAIVVLDATFLRHLVDPSSVEALRKASRAWALEPWPSVVNVLEALKHPNRQIRERLIVAIAGWCEFRPLLPWPPTLMKLAGESALKDRYESTIKSTDLDYLVANHRALDDDRQKAVTFLADIDKSFADAHLASRPEVRAVLKRDGLVNAWPTAADYLDTQWNVPESRDHLIALLWSTLGLPGEPPIAALDRSEVWRLAVEALGVSFYYRMIRKEQQRNPAGQIDLMQLVYLSMFTRRRVLVTDDGSFAEAARSQLYGRYPNTRVLTAAELLGS
ncbi:MAG: hypothetical protein AB7L66_05155 [Gemmatimonadales bacterium]